MIQGARNARGLLAGAAIAALCAVGGAAQAQSVAFSGMLGNKALLVINGQAHGVAVGDTSEGVKLVKLDGTQAQVDVGGKLQILRLGGGAVVAEAPGADIGTRIVIRAIGGGHYGGTGSINGHAMKFMVDTGATYVSIGANDIGRLGIDFTDSQTHRMSTANGVATMQTVILPSVKIGDVTVRNVPAVVTSQPMPFILLGNSFLSHFRMRSDGDDMVLDKTL